VHRATMSRRVAFFVDVGYLRAEGAKRLRIPPAQCRIDAQATVETLKTVAAALWPDASFLRCYWYDGQYPSDHPGHDGQQRFLDAVGEVPGITLRLGTVKLVTPPWLTALEGRLGERGLSLESLGLRTGPIPVQKGVDTLIVLDMVRLAQKGAYDVAVLVAGDRDLLDAVRTVQDEGRLVVVLHPDGAGLAPELRRAADLVRALSDDELGVFLRARDALRG
jgi:uncharacterized LabA/DUF88 family protein